MDFTIKKYKDLLNALIGLEYPFQTFTGFLEKPEEKVIILRHDVDDKKLNSLRFAEIQHAMGITGTYYFRMVSQSYDPVVIKKIAEMGHEIGYHYEDMDVASSKFGVRSLKLKEEDVFDIAIELFEKNLKKFRELYPVKTICMHGSPRSSFDNKAIWNKYNYRDFGIIGEPYFDIDFSEVLYLTDTGRRWDGDKMSIRDKAGSSKFEVRSLKFEEAMDPIRNNQPTNALKKSAGFHSTNEIINAAAENKFSDKIMFTFHPQRWNDNLFPWMKELIFQNLKNQIKKYYVQRA